MDLLLDLDQAIFLSVNRLVGQVDLVDSFMAMIIEMPLVKLTVLVAIFWGLWFARPHDTVGRTCLIKAAVGVLAAMLASRLLQNLLPHRPRPINANLPGFRLPAGTNPEQFTSLTDWSSLPSDHAVVAFALAAAIWTRGRLLGAFAFAWAAVVICLPRLYLGRHYLSDLMVGAAIGAGIVLLSIQIRPLDALSSSTLRFESRMPAVFYVGAFAVSQQLATMFDDVRRIGSALVRAIRVAGLG
jgi:undecaprenyl-diphosphatase